jgi:hydrogenase maturation protease
VTARPIAVEIFVCGSTDRGDDGAAVTAAEVVRATLPADVRMRTVGQLDVDDLLAVGADAGVVIVDVATGIEPGVVVEMALARLHEREALCPHSSHALAVTGVVGLAELIGRRPLHGRVVAIGGARFALGGALSRPVAAGVPRLAIAIGEAVEHARRQDAGPGGAPCA